MRLLQNGIFLAWSDTKARYKKSIIGPFWPVLTNLIGILGLGIVWATLLKEDINTFVPSLTLGLVAWQLISGVLIDGPICFYRQAGMIKNVAIPAWFFVLRLVARHTINLLHNLVIVVGVILYFNLPITVTTWLVVPGLILVILNLFWIMFMLGLLGARFRDIEHLINSVVPLLFFISPVIFRADRLPVSMDIIWFNPLSYFIEVIRAPVLGAVPSLTAYVVLVGMLLFGSLATYGYSKAYGKRLAFWV
jgi:ABC-type polysaccharide/polyol phosphate export permease